MARTPLLRALQRMAEEHSTAARLGIDAAELRGRREEAYSRGEFLKRAGAVGVGALALPAVANAAAPTTNATNARIAIIGGGIAGLTAALTLADKGVFSDVYESSERVGGRMHSDWVEFGHTFWENGQQAELCGELIDTSHKTILQLAQRFGLQTVDLLAAQPNGTTDTYYVNGSRYSVAQASSDFQPVHQTLQGQLQAAPFPTLYNSFTQAGQSLDNMTLHDWIAAFVPGGLSSNFGTLLNAAYNEEYGAETTDQSSLNLVYLLGFGAKPGSFAIYGKSDERFHIAGGNTLLPLAIEDALPAGSVHTGYAMTAIAVNTDGSIKVSFGNGQSITADHVILCMSFAVLRTLNYKKANFEPLKQTAITQLGAGANVKLNMQFGSRIWNAAGSTGTVYTDLPLQSGWDVTRAQSGATGIFVEYPGANTSRSLAQSNPYTTNATNPAVTTAAQQALANLDQIFPGIAAQWNGKAMLSTPATDPNLNLSYSYWKPGQYTGFSGFEGVRQGNIHFAGEHCSTNFQGFMEGGASEGVRAANEILADLK
jgi:monoamine oxidase